MPNHALPGVKINIEDLSQVVRVNNSIIIGMVGQFERGPEKPILIGNDVVFNRYFGSIDYKAATGKAGVDSISYISAIMLLKEAEAVYIANCVGEDARFGSILLTRIGCIENDESLTSNESYDFVAGNANRQVQDEVLDTGDGIETTFSLILATTKTVEPGTIEIKFTIGTTEYTITDDGGGGWSGDVAQIDTDNSYMDYDSKTATIVFNTAPDDTIDITGSYYTVYVNGSVVSDEVIGAGDGIATTLTGTIGTFAGVLPGSVTIKFTIGTTEYTITDDGAGSFNDSSNQIDEDNSWIGYNDRSFEIVFDTAPDDATNITVDYELYDTMILGIFIPFSKKAWSNDFALKIVDYDSTSNSFSVEEYQRETDGTITLLNTYNVSRDPASKDGLGKNRYIQTIMNTKSYFFEYIDNTSMAYDTVIKDNESRIFSVGGDDGTTPTATNIAASVSNFNTPDVSLDVFCSAGQTDQNVINEIITLLDSKKRFGFYDTPAGSTQSEASTFGDAQADNRKAAFYAPWTYESYSGREWFCPPSAVAAMKYARRVTGGQPYMPPAGIGEDRGSLNSVRLDQYFTDAEIKLLNKSNINVIKYTRANGNVIFNDLTMQKTLSSTSYINSVLTLLKMEDVYGSALEFINFKVINTQTFLQLRVLIESVLEQLQRFEGTIEPDRWTVKIEELNDDATRDEKKIYAQVIFVFQSLAQEVILNLTYTSNQLYVEIV